MTESRDPMAPDGAVNPIDTDYKVGQDNILVNVGPFGLDIHNRVFAISGLLVVAFVVLTLAFQNQVEPLFTAMRGWLTSNLDWFFISAGNVFVLVCLGLAISPLGKVRLGGTEATPDYTYLGWFSMLFAAGMGIGLMFFGVSEPLSHFGSAFGGTAMENGVRTDWAPRSGASTCTPPATRARAEFGQSRSAGLSRSRFFCLFRLETAMNRPVMEGLKLNVPPHVKHERLIAWVAEIAALTQARGR